MSKVLFHGVMPALPTPLNEDGTLRRASVKPLIDYLIDAGCDGFYVCGATGEGVVMQPDARMEMTEAVIEATAGRGKVISHIGAVDLITAKKLAAHAAAAGADAISSVPPFFYGYNDDGIYNYYRALADAAELPLLMYACPLSGVPVTLSMVERLMTIPNMIGLKWTNPNYYEMHKISLLRGGDINVINGPDETFLCGLMMGAHAGIGSTYNVMPRVFVDIYNAFQKGDLAAARKAQYKADALIRVMLAHDGLASLKLMLTWNGFDMGHTTYPMKRLNDAEEASLRADLNAIDYENVYLRA
ncbi:MAG: dihydrodipicolinate synthase family protein [Clostridiaceae bacterium]|nr:dihydrodipicolinate synthase family protein [Clostridiaceae bacterium]